MKTDFIIVGQGLAGSLLAYHLLQAKQKVIILNDETLPTSSAVAAGVYNPVTSKRLTKSWLADDIFPYLENFYANLENTLSAKFLHKTKIYRPFVSIEEQNYFLSQTERHSLRKYLNDKIDNEKYNSLIINELSGLETLSAGWVNIPLMLRLLRDYFISQKVYFSEKYNSEKLQLLDNQVVYENVNSRKIIFSEGFYGRENPLSAWLPWNPVKGEILTVQTKEHFELKEIINQGIFILPTDSQTFKVGATYVWDKLDFEITDEAKNTLTQKLNKLLRVPYEIIEQQAGVRPATDDRRPFIGLHPKYPQVGIFNGLGTKGVSLAPYFSNHFVDFLVNDKDLMPEVNIERYYSLFS